MRENIADKLSRLKEKAKMVVSDEFLRHDPNERDVRICSENTRLLRASQEIAAPAIDRNACSQRKKWRHRFLFLPQGPMIVVLRVD